VDAAALTRERREDWAAHLTRFNFHVARFAHPSWHGQEQVVTRAEPALSASVLQELGLQDEFDWEMTEPQRRIWLLDTQTLLRLGEETALAMHRDWLVRIIDGTRVRALLTKIDRDALRFVIQEVAEGSFHYHSPIVSFGADPPQDIRPTLQAAGARTLIALIHPTWHAVRGRAPLHFDRSWKLDEVPPFDSEQGQRALELIVGKLIPRRFPEWAWLF
jgi:hypothetical protein